MHPQFTFKRFLDILSEDANVDKMITDLQTSLANLDSQINQRTQPLVNQKLQLQKRLAPLLKRKQAYDAKTRKDAQNQENIQPKPGVITPGSTGNATPGV